MGGYGGCCVNFSDKFSPPNIVWLCNNPKSPEKNKGKNVYVSVSESVQSSYVQQSHYGELLSIMRVTCLAGTPFLFSP